MNEDDQLCEACHGTGDVQPHAVVGFQDERCSECGGTGERPYGLKDNALYQKLGFIRRRRC